MSAFQSLTVSCISSKRPGNHPCASCWWSLRPCDVISAHCIPERSGPATRRAISDAPHSGNRLIKLAVSSPHFEPWNTKTNRGITRENMYGLLKRPSFDPYNAVNFASVVSMSLGTALSQECVEPIASEAWPSAICH